MYEVLLLLKVIKVVEVSLNGSKFMPTNNQNCNVKIQTLRNCIILVAVMKIFHLEQKLLQLTGKI